MANQYMEFDRNRTGIFNTRPNTIRRTHTDLWTASFEGSTAMFYFIFNCYADTYRLRRFEVLPCSTLFSNTIVRWRHINL